jgi:hypothetical protein
MGAAQCSRYLCLQFVGGAAVLAILAPCFVVGIMIELPDLRRHAAADRSTGPHKGRAAVG